MELNINSPVYFSQHYGIDDEVYRFCQNAYIFFKDKEYSDILHIIGITPVAAPQELYDAGAWKESVELISNKSSDDLKWAIGCDLLKEKWKKTIQNWKLKTKKPLCYKLKIHW